MKFLSFLKYKRNKIAALSFVLAALACFIAGIVFYYIYLGGFSVGFSSFLRLFFFFFEGGILTYLLVMNIQNDARAYQAILMWIFWFFIDELQGFLSSSSVFALIASGASLPVILLSFASPFLALGALGLGITLYFHVRRYIVGRTSFKRVRLFAWLYVAASFLYCAATFLIPLLYRNGFFLSDLLFLLTKVLADIGVAFTLERLRR